ncbi:transmembrane protein 176A [Cricetulus griseus]
MSVLRNTRALGFNPQGQIRLDKMMETAHVGEVALRAPQPTHIDVHIHQESALAQLLLAGCSALRLPESASTRSLGSSRLLVASWVVQIVLGLLSVVLGGMLYICHYLAMNTSGAPFWTGIVALLRTLLVLMNFCMSVAAIVLGACEFNVYRYYLRDDVCVSYSSNHWPTKPPNTPGPEEADRIGLCIFYTSMLKKFPLAPEIQGDKVMLAPVDAAE